MSHARQTAPAWRAMPLVFFALGVCSVMVQAVLVRELLAVFFGSELTLGIVLGSWLVWIAIGAQVGAGLVRWPRAAAWLFFVLAVVGVATAFAQVSVVREARLLLHTPMGEYVPMKAAAKFVALAVAPFPLMVGLTFPLGARLFGGATGDASSSGRLYAAEALGFLGGGLLFTFALVGRVGALDVLSICLGILLVALMAACTCHVLQGGGRMLPAAVIVLSAASLALPLRAPALSLWSTARRWAGVAPSYRLVRTADTPYQNVSIGEYYEQYTVYTNGQVGASFPDPYTYGLAANFILLEHPNPRRVLLVGGGAEGMLQEMLKSPIDTLHYVQSDSGLLRAIEPFLDPGDQMALSDPRVTVIHEDARAYVRRTRERYDLVFANVGDPSTAALNRFFTVGFFREARHILTPGGVFGTRMTSAVNTVGEEIGLHSGTVYYSLRQAFPEVEVTWDTVNYFFASDQPGVLSVDPAELARRFLDRGVQTDYFSDAHPELLLQPGRSEAIEAALSAPEYANLNSDLSPVAYYYNLLLWDRFSESGLGPTLRWVARRGLAVCIAAILVVLSGRLLLGRESSGGAPRRFDAAYGIFAIGLCGMGLEIAFLLAFQNLFGSLYRMVALVTAAFMAGLAWAGLRTALRLREWRGDPSRALAKVALAMTVLSAGGHLLVIRGAYLTAHVSTPGAHLMLLFGVALAGALTGAAFPLATATHVANGGTSARSAGIIDAADHLGGAIGAGLLGSLLIPLLGLPGASAVLAAATGSAALLLFLPGRTRSTASPDEPAAESLGESCPPT